MFFIVFSLIIDLFFSDRVSDVDGVEPVACQPWTSRLSKMAQPNLDYTGTVLFPSFPPNAKHSVTYT